MSYEQFAHWLNGMCYAIGTGDNDASTYNLPSQDQWDAINEKLNDLMLD